MPCGYPCRSHKNETLYTPHAGEFMRMTGIKLSDDTIERAVAARGARAAGHTAPQGMHDIITDGNRVRFNRTGDPAMTVGGTGDVLAGIAGALLCHLPAFEAGCIAAYVNGRAGQYCCRKAGRGYAGF